MKEELELSNNCLADIIRWLKKGYIVCFYAYGKMLYYHVNETLEQITNEKIVYINLAADPLLMEEDEWPYYIKNEGYVEYKSVQVLPKNSDDVYSMKL